MPLPKKKYRVSNSKGKIFYGMHFYPGIATARPDPEQDEIKVFLNSSTIRKMDASFSGCPVYVLHVDGVADNVDDMRKEADGFVTESFYNAADGKHWAKLMIVSDRGLRAIEKGYRLSNCYVPKSYKGRGVWNGIAYDREVADGEYEHMAIVPNPRYDESVILTPEQFHAYNESQDREIELTRLANEREKPVALKIFTRKRIENKAISLEDTIVQLPKSGKEVSLAACVKNADEAMMKKTKPAMANADDMVEARGKKMTVAGLLQNYDKMCDELADFKKASEDSDDEGFANEDDDSMDNEDDDADSDDGDDSMENEDDIGPEDEDMDNDLDVDQDDDLLKAKKKEDARKLENSRRKSAPKKKAAPPRKVSNRRDEEDADDEEKAPRRRVANADAKKPERKTPEQIANARERARRLRDAADRYENDGDVVEIDTAPAQVARGLARYG